jgi:PST family polysaccharide transporter/lipopolysaccharide exporter
MEMLGYYVVAYTLANIPATYVSKLVGKVLFPMFSQLQNDLPRLREAYAKGMRLVITVVLPASVGMVLLAPEIIRALYGSKWAAAAAPLAILSVFGCFRALWTLNGYLCNAIGRPQVDFYFNLGRLLVMAGLLPPLTAKFGVIGASAAVTVPMVLQFLVGVFLSQWLIAAPLRIAGEPLAIAAGQCAVMALVVLVAKSLVAADPPIALVSLVAIGAAVYTALNYRQIRNLYVAYAAR